MLERMTSTQLLEWEVMFARWHMGDSPHDRAEITTANLASWIVNTQPGRKKPIPLETFMPTFTEQTEPDAQANAAALRNRMLSLANRGKKP